MQTLPLLICLAGLGLSEPADGVIPKHSTPVQLLHAHGDVLTIKWDSVEMRRRHQSKHRFVLEGVPISATQRVDLELTPFSVAGPDTRFVLARKGAPDEPFSFDTSRVQAFRGRVKDRAGSDVFVVFGDFQTTGYIDLGAGHRAPGTGQPACRAGLLVDCSFRPRTSAASRFRMARLRFSRPEAPPDISLPFLFAGSRMGSARVG